MIWSPVLLRKCIVHVLKQTNFQNGMWIGYGEVQFHPYEHAFTHEAKLPQMTVFTYNRSNIHEIILFYLTTWILDRVFVALKIWFFFGIFRNNSTDFYYSPVSSPVYVIYMAMHGLVNEPIHYYDALTESRCSRYV